MTRGGGRNRSGPQADPSSARSERRGFKLTALPAEGYQEEAPEFPLPQREVFKKETDAEGVTSMVFDKAATAKVAAREAALWAWAWTTPQACAWSMPSESWRLHTVAMWVRVHVLCEGSDATAADKGSLHRFADQIGMTPAGLRENGWAVAQDQVAAKAAEKKAPTDTSASRSPRRLRAAADAQ